MVRKRRDLLAASRVKLVVRDSVTAVYGGAKPSVLRPAKVTSKVENLADGPEIVPSPTEKKKRLTAPKTAAPQAPPKREKSKVEEEEPAVAVSPRQNEERDDGPAEFMPVTVRFPASYPMDVQTVDLPLHFSVEDGIKYMLDVALVSDEKVIGENKTKKNNPNSLFYRRLIWFWLFLQSQKVQICEDSNVLHCGL
jgi:hypothetical protein